MSTLPVQLGLRENAGQFWLLVLINAFVGAMIGMERSILPAMAEQEFSLLAKSAVLSFIVAFGISKAFTNYFAGHLSDLYGRKTILIAGWWVAVPVPFMLIWAPSWNWVLVANMLLGISQGLTWSTTIIMKIDLVGPKRRGLAMGLNEFAGYFALALSALATGWIAARHGLRPEPFYLGIAYAMLGLILSIVLVRETRHFVSHETGASVLVDEKPMTRKELFRKVSFTDHNLSSVSQTGFVNNLNDGMAWGLFPILFATAGATLAEIGMLAAIYPAVWGLAQIGTGALSDRIGRKQLIVSGMWIQALGILITAISEQMQGFVIGAILLGLGTAMVYPTLLAAIGDVARPGWRASAVGIYRFWRDIGYAAGAVLAGVTADLFGVPAAVYLVAALTFVSGLITALRMKETLPKIDS